MEHWYHIYFEDKAEFADVEDTLKQYQIGQLLFSFLDIDWDAIVSELSELRQEYPDTMIIKEYYLKLRERFLSSHPFIFHTISRLTLEADLDTLKTLYIRLAALARFKAEIIRTISLTLDADGDYNELTPMQRYYLLQSSGPGLSIQAQKMYDLISIQHRISKNGKRVFSLGRREITQKVIDEIAASELLAYSFYCADDICALVFLEFEYMCTKGLVIRKCGHCGHYFLPHSMVSLYCDRTVNGKEKSCKEIGAKEKYNQKVNLDEAKKLYTRLNNTYQMRCSRAPSVYRVEDRYAWQDRAREMLKNVDAGIMSFEDFAEAIKLPEKK